MRLSAYIILMMSITMMLYLGGFHPIMGGTFDTWLTNMVGPGANTTAAAQPMTYQNLTSGNMSSGQGPSVFNLFGMYTTSDNILVIAIGLISITAIGILLSGFSANFLVPLLILGVLVTLNLFFFPLNFLTDPSIGMPVILKIFIAATLNTLAVIAIIDFVRGGM